MRKIEPMFENPIDNVLIDLANLLCPAFKAMGFTPNGITTLSLITGLLSCYFLYYDHVYLFAVTYAVSYWFDIFDGHFARRYKMTSATGCYYDHAKDLCVFLLLVYILYKKNSHCTSNLKSVLIILAIMFVLMNVTLGCQERIYNKDESPALSYQKELCFGDPEETIKYTRFFGCGSFVLVFILCVIYIEKTKVCK